MPSSIGLITLNARFIHSALSLRYLRNAACNAGYENVWLQEFIINQPTWKIAAEILKRKPDVLGIGIYIWNRQQSLELIEMLQKQNPDLHICVGGPEVSFDAEPPTGCTLISGEGEAKWVDYLNHLRDGKTPSAATLAEWKTYGTSLPELIAPYRTEDLPQLQNRYAYIETSRGCPYLCSFCLSALDEKVRYFDEELIQQQIQMLIDAGIRKFKFVDRTFNLHPKRMRKLMEWLGQFTDREFHFEVVGDLLNDSMLEFLSTVPRGVFQFEIGVQTIDDAVNEHIDRKQNREKLFTAIRRLIDEDRIHLHCDLIFGLPGETLEDIRHSFESVLSLGPHELQLGFLKFLPGAPITRDIEAFQYQYLSVPPYEIISSRDLPCDQVLHLKRFNEVFDIFYNSKRFQFSLRRLLTLHAGMELFEKLLEQADAQGGPMNAMSLERQYQLFAETFKLDEDAEARDLLKLDYLYNQRSFRLPEFMRRAPWSSNNGKTRTWQGDGKTPVVEFQHRLEPGKTEIALFPSVSPCYYAIAHPERDSGYFQKPTLNPVPEEAIK